MSEGHMLDDVVRPFERMMQSAGVLQFFSVVKLVVIVLLRVNRLSRRPSRARVLLLGHGGRVLQVRVLSGQLLDHVLKAAALLVLVRQHPLPLATLRAGQLGVLGTGLREKRGQDKTTGREKG